MKADENIPIPIKIGGRLKHPWALLDTDGKSLFIEAAKSSGVITGAKAYWKRRGIEAGFTTRIVTENGIRGVRVWRTS